MWCNSATRRLAPLWRLYWDLGFEPEGEVPSRGPLLLAANHSCFLDPWFLSVLFPRPVHYLINREWYDRSPWWRRFFDANGVIPVAPRDPEATLERIREKLDREGVVGLFPEGRISPDGRLQRFRSGIAHVAARTGAPVLPLWIEGAHDSLPRSRRLPRPGRVTVRTGTARVFPGAPTDAPLSRQVIAAFLADLRGEMIRLGKLHPRDLRDLDQEPSSA